MLHRLVAFDTTSRGSNLALIAFVRDHLGRCGVASELVFDETGHKANLYAKLGPREAGGIMLSGHTDVVPVDGQEWHSDPFRVVARDGRLYGRGTADMKGFLAVILALLPEIVGGRSGSRSTSPFPTMRRSAAAACAGSFRRSPRAPTARPFALSASRPRCGR